MAIRCDICEEEYSSIGTFCIIVTSVFGSMVFVEMFTDSFWVLIGGGVGLSFGCYFVYKNNPKHIQHTVLDKFTKRK